MAKNKIEVPVYPAAPLKISREKFCSLLNDQLEKSEELLKIEVPVAPRSPFASYGHRSDNVDYDNDALNEFTAKYNRWNDRNLAIYRESFTNPRSIYYHEYESNIWDHFYTTDLLKAFKDEIKRLCNHMQSDIERVDLIQCIALEEKTVVVQKPEKEKPYKVFISHSSKDSEFVYHLVDLLEAIGIDEKDKLFCSSVPLYDIDLTGKIFETLLSQFHDFRLFVIFVHSPNYYDSPVSLNEMGAAWVLKTEFCSFLTKGFPFNKMNGVVTSNEIAIKVDAKDADHRLNQLRDKLTTLFALNQVANDKWEWKRKLFLERVNK